VKKTSSVSDKAGDTFQKRPLGRTRRPGERRLAPRTRGRKAKAEAKTHGQDYDSIEKLSKKEKTGGPP